MNVQSPSGLRLNYNIKDIIEYRTINTLMKSFVGEFEDEDGDFFTANFLAVSGKSKI